ncbi:MAG: two-component regulator propeller domain-containing protein [Prolixibacteraceae bacterium]
MTTGKGKNLKLLQLIVFFIFTGFYSNVTAESDLWFRNLSIKDGLSGNYAECMLQDSRGFLWIGTRDGLNIYDGYKFTTLKKNTLSPYFSNYVTSLFEDEDGNIWIGSLSNGIVIYDFEHKQFSKLACDPSFANQFDEVTAWQIISDQQGFIWIATTEGLFKYSTQENKIVDSYFTNQRQGNSSKFIRCMAYDKNHNLWIGCDDDGLKKYDATNDTFIEFRNDLQDKNGISSNKIRTLYFEDDSLLWIGTTDHGINILNIKNFHNKRISLTDINNHPIDGVATTAFLKDSKNNFWICTQNEGLKRYDKNSGTLSSFYHHDYDLKSLPSNSINCILEDSFGIIWISTQFSGISNFYPSNFGFELHQHVPFNDMSPSNNNTRTFCEDQDKNIWVGTDGGGIDIYDFNLKKIKNINRNNAPFKFESNVALSIVTDQDYNIWIGTWGDGLIKYNPSNKTYLQFKNLSNNQKSLSSDFILDLACDNENNLWVSCYKEGLNLLPNNSKEFVHFNAQKSNSSTTDTYHINNIIKDSKDNLWMATLGNGVFTKKGNLFYSYLADANNPNTLSNNIVNTVFEDSKKRIWVGTSSKLNLYNDEADNFTHFGIEDGFNNETIYNIQEDENGILWLSTNNGIIKFNPENTEVENFDFRYQILEGQFNVNAGIRLSDNRILFGGLNGFNAFKPEKITQIKSTPIIQLTNFLLFNEPQIPNAKGSPLNSDLNITQKLKLSYKQRVFTIEYVGINYHNPAGTEYAYILENFDEDWNYVGSKQSATYTNLRPGKYLFKLKAKNGDNEWSIANQTLAIQISPPFWRTPIAFIIYFIFIFQSLVLLRGLTIKREQEKSAYEFEKYKVKKSEELDLLRMRFFTNISHDLKTPLTLIIAPIEQLLKTEAEETKKYQLRTIHRNATRLLKLINQIMDLRKQETGNLKLNLDHGEINAFVKNIADSYEDIVKQRKIKFIYTPCPVNINTAFDHDKLDKIIFNLLSNAFKYTPENGVIEIRIELKNSMDLENKDEKGTIITSPKAIAISVVDSGIGIAHEECSKIFERFYQIKHSSDHKQEGTGIGLSLANDFAKLHGGWIEVESEPDKGSIFTLLFPSSGGQFIENISTSMNIEEDELSDEIDNQLQIELQTSNKQTILVVEDNYDLRDYLVNLLSINYHVLAASDGEEGIELAENKIPDIIIADIMMPKLDGIEMLKVLKRNIRTNHIPFILLTAKSSDMDRLNGLKEGADDYITKPFNIDILETRIKNLLAIRKNLKEKYIRHLKLDPKDVEIENEDEKFLRKALRIVEENIENSEFSVEVFALEMGLSRVHLYRKLHALIEESPVDFIKRIRLKRAAQLLSESQMNVSEVCYAVGFKNPVYFAKCFKKEYKMLPSDYKPEKAD